MPPASHQPFEDEPSTRAIDLSLDDFARELELRDRSESELGPVVGALLQALSEWTLHQDSPDVLDKTFVAREAYVRALNGWRPLLKEWIPIRHTALRLEAWSGLMSDTQWERFNRLQALEAQGLSSTSTLDDDHQRVQPLLQKFDAVKRRR